jgi:hypothetical protein
MPPVDIAIKIATAINVTVEYLVTGQETGKQDKILDHTIRSIMQILPELNERDIETILCLAKFFKNTK